MKTRTLKRRGLQLGVLLLAICGLVPATAQEVELGGVAFDLGAERGDALAVANAHFNVVPTDNGGQYMLFPKRGPMVEGRDTYGKPIGTITVNNGRLERITRNLGTFRSEDGERAIERLIQAFAEAPNTGNRPAVRTDHGNSGQAQTSRVYFSYPDRAIQLVLYRPPNRTGLATIDITEQFALRDRSGSKRGDAR